MRKGFCGSPADISEQNLSPPATARSDTAVPDHLGKPDIAGGTPALRDWRDAVAPLAAHSNVSAKLAGLVTRAAPGRWTVADLRLFVETAVELFGPERLMFGSDWPVCLLAAGYATVVSSLQAALPPLSAAEHAEIFAGTAERMYRLPPPSAG